MKFGLPVFLSLFLLGCASTGNSLSPTFASTETSLSYPRQIFALTKLTSNSLNYFLSGGVKGSHPKEGISDKGLLLTFHGETAHSSEYKLAQARFGHLALVKADNLFLCGGNQERQCEVFKIILSGGRVTELKKDVSSLALQTPRGASAGLVLPDGRLLISGGYDNSKSGTTSDPHGLQSIEILDPRANKKSVVLDMLAKRAGHLAVQWKDGIFLIGGLSEQAATVERFDIGTQKISATPMRFLRPLKDFQALQDGHRVFIFGGTGPDGNSSNEIVRLDLDSQSIRLEKFTLSQAREDMTLCDFTDSDGHRKAFLIGGEIKGLGKNGKHSGIVDLVEIANGELTKVTQVSQSVFRDDSRSLVQNGRCLIFGGTDENSMVIPEVLTLSP